MVKLKSVGRLTKSPLTDAGMTTSFPTGRQIGDLRWTVLVQVRKRMSLAMLRNFLVPTTVQKSQVPIMVRRQNGQVMVRNKLKEEDRYVDGVLFPTSLFPSNSGMHFWTEEDYSPLQTSISSRAKQYKRCMLLHSPKR